MDHRVRRHLESGSGYLELKMYGDALAEADAALALDPTQPQALALKAAVLWQTDRLTEAEPLMARLADLNPKESGLWVNLAYIRRRTHSIEAAVDTLQRALVSNPQDALAHFNMACYRALQQRSHEALEMLRNALFLDPKLRTAAQKEPDFQNLRGLPEFEALLKARREQKG